MIVLFPQACGITVKTLEKTNVRCASATVGSKLHMRLRIIGTEGNTWKHSTDSGGQVGCNVEKVKATTYDIIVCLLMIIFPPTNS